MHITSNIALISINGTLAFQLISFLLFLFIINRLMFRPLRNVMEERDGHIGKIELDIADKEKEFQNVTDQLQQKESTVKKEAFLLQLELEDAGNRQAAKILDVARKEIETLKAAAQKKVDAQISEAGKDLSRASEALAISIMEKMLDRRLVQ
jgi:F-type H+-transporting ATPase subunit b